MAEEGTYQIKIGDEGAEPTSIDLATLEGDNFEAVKSFVNENYTKFLPEDLAADPSMENVRTLDNLGKNYISTKKMVGSEKVPIPTDDSPEEVWQNYYKAFGVPEDETGYELPIHEQYEKNWDQIAEDYQEREKAFKNLMLELKVPAKSAQKLWQHSQDEYFNSMTETQKAYQKRLDEEWNGLKKEWGDNFDEKLKHADSVANSVLTDDDIKWFKSKGLDKEPKLWGILNKFGTLMSEDKIKSRPVTPAERKGTEAMREVNRMLEDKSHPLHNALMSRSHPDHEYAVEQYNKMVKQAEEK